MNFYIPTPKEYMDKLMDEFFESFDNNTSCRENRRNHFIFESALQRSEEYHRITKGEN